MPSSAPRETGGSGGTDLCRVADARRRPRRVADARKRFERTGPRRGQETVTIVLPDQALKRRAVDHRV